MQRREPATPATENQRGQQRKTDHHSTFASSRPLRLPQPVTLPLLLSCSVSSSSFPSPPQPPPVAPSQSPTPSSGPASSPAPPTGLLLLLLLLLDPAAHAASVALASRPSRSAGAPPPSRRDPPPSLRQLSCLQAGIWPPDAPHRAVQRIIFSYSILEEQGRLALRSLLQYKPPEQRKHEIYPMK